MIFLNCLLATILINGFSVYSFLNDFRSNVRTLTPPEQCLIRKIQINKGLSNGVKTKVDKLVCFHFIPLALSESKRFTYKYRINRSLWGEYNAIAVNGLLRGVSKYDWTRQYSNLSLFLRKYIQYELYHTQNRYATIYDDELLEWKLNSPPDEEVESYYAMVKNKITEAASRLSPQDRRLFFQMYDNETLQRTAYNTDALCQLSGIQNPETLRLKINEIVRQIQFWLDDMPE